MLGEPQDKEDECNARLFIGDNYGDGTATMRCQLGPGHGGVHQEQFTRRGALVTITWVHDERERCDHGCGQWRHAHNDENITCPNDAADHEYSDCHYCHPATEGTVCPACGKTYYYAEGHARSCVKRPFQCASCGARGGGTHACPNIDTHNANADGDDFG